jgi:hypothetical protein
MVRVTQMVSMTKGIRRKSKVIIAHDTNSITGQSERRVEVEADRIEKTMEIACSTDMIQDGGGKEGGACIGREQVCTSMDLAVDDCDDRSMITGHDDCDECT